MLKRNITLFLISLTLSVSACGINPVTKKESFKSSLKRKKSP